MMRELIHWLTHTPVNHLVMDYRWTWPTAESLHFCALALMVGTVGTFDLRLLGLGKGDLTGHAALFDPVRRPAGFCRVRRHGRALIFGQPDQYFYNNAFKVKVVCLLLLGSTSAFVCARGAPVLKLGAGDDTRRARRFSRLSHLRCSSRSCAPGAC